MEEILFDLLKGESEPITVFGIPFRSIENENEISKITETAVTSINRIFKKSITITIDGIKTLEEIIRGMWKDDWNPKKGNLNLFSTHFGSILTKIIVKEIGGQIYLRDIQNLLHLSVFFDNRNIEIFPFHKIYKRLNDEEGDDLIYYYKSIKALL